MIPFLEYGGGSCQETRMLEEEPAVAVKLVGACEGAEIKEKLY